MLNIEFLKNKSAEGLIKVIRAFIFTLERFMTRPQKSYAGYTVLPCIAIPFPPPRKLIPHLSAWSCSDVKSVL
jgi:hypothetical protein